MKKEITNILIFKLKKLNKNKIKYYSKGENFRNSYIDTPVVKKTTINEVNHQFKRRHKTYNVLIFYL